MRRKPGSILPIEEAILAAGMDLQRPGEGDFHGFLVAKHMEEIGEAKLLIAHGTLYKALSRMEHAGLLESHWEDPDGVSPQQELRIELHPPVTILIQASDVWSTNLSSQ